jgi:ribose 5-phosphate isomerase A
MVVITDPTKHVETLGAFPLPVEVIPFGWKASKTLIEEALINLDVMGREVTLRQNGSEPFRTDEGNLILDLHLKRIENARQVSLVLNQIPGIVENGLFLDLCDVVIVGASDGGVIVRDINDGTVTTEQVDVNESDNIFTVVSD